MTGRPKKRSRREKWTGLAALGTILAILLLAAVSMESQREPSEPPAPPPLETNPYGPEDFQFQGDYLTCTAGESVLGIDVSVYQQDIDWQAVKEAGVEFVMIRLGYRGNQEGTLEKDERAQENYQGAKAAGLKVGAYFFSQAVSVEEAVEEAAFALEIAAGWELEMPLVYDWEYMGENARTANVDARTLTDCTLAFCQQVERQGYQAMIYFNVSQSEYLLHLEELTAYPFWLAMYKDQMDFPYRVDMWQYTEKGTVPGISTPVDLNLWLPG